MLIQDSFGRILLKGLALNVVFCTLIAVFLSIVGFAPRGEATTFWQNFVFSQCVGNFCCLLVMLARHRVPSGNRGLFLVATMAALVTGGVMGCILAALLLGIDLSDFFRNYRFVLRVILGTIWFGTIIVYFWRSHEKVLETQALAQEEKLKRLTSEKEVVETKLKLLQAQIEPHFLFNTLSNILTLLDSDPARGKSMLSDLAHYLRTSLSKSRQEMSTVAQEMDLIGDYLKIYQVRMGDRLRFTIDVPDDLAGALLPPMLVQPLVENAIKHGLEPKIEGGDITIGVGATRDRLRIEVMDTGLGLGAAARTGTGLSNIRQRIKSLYGEKGRLTIENNQPAGVKAAGEIPYANR